MYCCSNCFDDRHLLTVVLPRFGGSIGTCDYCGTLETLLVAPADLRDEFELLLGAYEASSTGKPLLDQLTDDWQVFTKSCLGSGRAVQLLNDILGDQDFAVGRYIPKEGEGGVLLEKWHEFRSELMRRNRFFPKRRPNLRRLRELLAYLLAPACECLRVMFRARILDGEKPYLAEQMGAPPAAVALHGRANPAGIPYLYLASDPETAVSELRPHTGDRACVADFALPSKLKLVDLRDPKGTVSPFAMPDESKIVLLRRDLAFLNELGHELTRPVGSRGAQIQYLPSQYLCEFIKSCRFNGVMYKSSVGPGVNVALFDPGIATVGQVRQYSVTRVSVDAVRI
jgi:hypothetical protein